MSRLPPSLRSARQVLQGANHILQTLFAQSQNLNSLQRVVNRVVSDDVLVSSFKNNELALTVPSSATATNLRYREQNLVNALRKRGMTVNSIKITVKPRYEPPPAASIERSISSESAKLIRNTADDVEDKALRDALIKLANRRNHTSE